jgi:hypothetical protein
MKHLLPIPALALLTACAPTSQYASPETFGLIGVRPYPGANDVCQVIGENDVTNPYLDDSAILVGCPLSEAGAIKDRNSEGGTIVELVGEWVLISIPDEV